MAIPTAQELNQKITFQTATGGRNLRGGRTTLVTYKTVWARINETAGFLESETMQTQGATKTFDIWCRYNDATALTGYHQILWGTRVLVLLAPPLKVIDGGSRQWWQLTAGEKTEHD